MKLGIFCDNESRLLSNDWDQDLWDAFQQMMEILITKSKPAGRETLFAWREPHHVAIAKEPYAWRAALDALKDSDLTATFIEFKGREDFVLMTDKPTMLKLGGEITNSLMHSYTTKHKISFRQVESKEPSLLAL